MPGIVIFIRKTKVNQQVKQEVTTDKQTLTSEAIPIVYWVPRYLTAKAFEFSSIF